MSANLEIISQYQELKKNVQTLLQEKGSIVAEELFKQFFEKHVGLTKLVIYGYTPGFNDGEPCVHSQRVVIGTSWGDGKYFDFSDEEDLEEFFEFNEETSTHVNTTCTSLDNTGSYLEELQEIFQGIYGTNFELRISYVNGSVVIEQDTYDCGY